MTIASDADRDMARVAEDLARIRDRRCLECGGPTGTVGHMVECKACGEFMSAEEYAPRGVYSTEAGRAAMVGYVFDCFWESLSWLVRKHQTQEDTEAARREAWERGVE